MVYPQESHVITDIVKSVFGFPSLRQDQVPVIESIRNGQDTYAIMTTGGGKSLCFQATAIERYHKGQGATIIVSPLISLMQDQVNALRSKSVAAGNLNSSVPSAERYRTLADLHMGKLPIVYMSPEMLGSDEVKECLKQTRLSGVVYDEAHTVSVWGANFRPSYTRVNDHISEIEAHQGVRLHRSAFTATSHKDVTDDVVKFLGMHNPHIIQGDPDRPNIAMHVEKSQNKTQDCLNILSQDPEATTIVYCTTVKNVKAFSQRLNEKGYSAKPYYAALSEDLKKKTLNDFISGNTKIIVATIAFGMGIDKDNVRRVIHMDMPSSIENYYQEIGRAGRDGKPSEAHMLYSPNDRAVHNYFIHWQFPPQNIVEEVKETCLALVSSGPQTFSSSIIAQACHSDIEPRHVVSSISILTEFGVLESKQELGTDSFMLAEGDVDNEVDYDILQKRKSINSDKLSTMKRYALTSNCKRDFLLKYFDHHGGDKFCGNCGSCLEKARNNERLSDAVDSNYRDAIITAIKATKGKYETTIAVLAGRASPRIERKGYTKSSSFSSLSHITEDEIRGLIKKLSNHGVIEITDGQLLVKAHSSNDKISPAVSDLRSSLSKELKLPVFMVMSESQAKELSGKEKITPESMREVGIAEKVIDKAEKALSEKSISIEI